MSASLLPEAVFQKKMRGWYLNKYPSLLANRRRFLLADVIFWVSLAMALAGPEYAEVNTDTENKHGDIYLLLLDLSASMNSRDEQPTRLLRAKAESILLAQRLAPSDRLGVVLFAGSAHLLFPPSRDKQAAEFMLKNIQPDMLPLAGSSILPALTYSQSLLDQYDDAVSKYFILISDGDIDNDNAVLKDIAQAKLNLAINTLAVGKTRNAAVPSHSNNEAWLRNNDGRIVTSNRNDHFLRELATNSGGSFQQISNKPADSEFISSNKQVANSYQESSRGNNNWIQLYHGFLCLAMIVFFYRHILAGR
ncbi:MAG: VWA domain-containing protein [Gammaproteobacteria bacterium]|nr:VWA domain-containing protein [Gammaproteobacteria bacterium]